MALLAAHRFEEAAELSRRALAKKPDEPGWLLGRAWALVGLGHLDQALEHARAAAALDGRNAAAFRTIAAVFLQMGRLDAALEAAQHAVRIDLDRTSVDLLNRIREERAARAVGSVKDSHLRRVPTGELEESAAILMHARRHTAEQAVQPPDSQLAALFGASLFGAWDESLDAAASPVWIRYLTPILSKRAVAVMLILVVVATLSGVVVAEGLRIARASDRRTATELMRQMLHSGAVEQLAVFLASPAANNVDAALARRAHATVYRYVDADPAHLAMQAAADDPVAAALPLARVERLDQLEALRRPEVEKDPQAMLLAAETLARAGDLPAARETLARADELEPSNVLHAALRVELELADNRPSAARNAAAAALDINPHAYWTRVAARRASIPPPDDVEGVAPESPVTRGHLLIHEALGGTSDDASGPIADAVAAVRGEPAFLLDWLDTFLAAGKPELARMLVADPSWPDTPAGRAGRARLRARGDEAGPAAVDLAAVWQEGFRDPRIAIAAFEAGDPGLLAEAVAAFPERVDLRIYLAETLVKQSDVLRAQTQLEGVPKRLGDTRLAARAFLVRARLAEAAGEHREAIKLARQAVQKDRKNHEARTLLESLSAGVERSSKPKKKRLRRKRRRH
jgi:tetratricopeptide (TPR) repeat protein